MRPLLKMEVDKMTDKEIIANAITRFMNLQRIDKAADRDAEIRNQYKELKAQLEAFGVVVEDLTIE